MQTVAANAVPETWAGDAPTESSSPLQAQYPWTKAPFICSAPMRLISGPDLAHAVSDAGGLGFIGAGVIGKDTKLQEIQERIKETLTLFAHPAQTKYPEDVSPFGIGFLVVGGPSEDEAYAAVGALSMPKPPAAIWLFPAFDPHMLQVWTQGFRAKVRSKTKIWIQVGSVAQALEIAKLCRPDVLVIQGNDAGGHGFAHSASIMALLPEVDDALKNAGFDIPLVAAGGIADGRGVAAATMLGSSGCAMGTRFLASEEANISHGYRQAVLDASDGGVSTVRTDVYDRLRGTAAWPPGYNGRGVANRSWWDSKVVDESENRRRYGEAMAQGDLAWGPDGRATTYAGTAVGLVKGKKPAGEIVFEVREEATRLLLKGARR